MVTVQITYPELLGVLLEVTDVDVVWPALAQSDSHRMINAEFAAKHQLGGDASLVLVASHEEVVGSLVPELANPTDSGLGVHELLVEREGNLGLCL